MYKGESVGTVDLGNLDLGNLGVSSLALIHTE